jgi:hypothetical protein
MLADDGIISKSEIANELKGLINDQYKSMNAEQIYEDPNVMPPPNDQPKEQEPGQGGGPDQPLTAGDVIRNERTGGYGVVTSIDETTGEVDYDPISKEEAIKIVNG